MRTKVLGIVFLLSLGLATLTPAGAHEAHCDDAFVIMTAGYAEWRDPGKEARYEEYGPDDVRAGETSVQRETCAVKELETFDALTLGELKEEINTWLKENPHFEILSIDFKKVPTYYLVFVLYKRPC